MGPQYQSDDELLLQNSLPSTMPPSPKMQPTLSPLTTNRPSPRPRKKVGWTEDSPSLSATLRPSFGRSNSDGLLERLEGDSQIITPPLPTAMVSTQEGSEHAELRRSVTRMFSHSPQSTPSGSGSPAPSLPAPVRPKAILRSGNATPVVRSPPSEEEEVPNKAGKELSAQLAQQRASAVLYDLNTGDNASDHASQGRGRSKSTDKSQSRDNSKKRNQTKDRWTGFYSPPTASGLSSGQTTPDYHGDDPYGDYIPRPSKYRIGPLAALNMLHNKVHSHRSSASRTSSVDNSRASSPAGSPRHSANASTSSLSELVKNSAAIGGRPGLGNHLNDSNPELLKPTRPGLPRNDSSNWLGKFTKKHGRLSSFDESQIKIHKHIQDITRRHRYLVKLCRALMQYGAPTHRLEEYMKMSARVLEIQAQFLYMPGCMIISFDDTATHTAEVKLVRVSQGVDLGKLWDTHAVYKDVVHDSIGVEEATARLEDLLKSPDKFKTWFSVLLYGLASASVAPFAFGAHWPDLGPAFLLGAILGFLRLVVAPASTLYSDVFEIVAVIITSFLARVFGSIHDGRIFCFSALAQSSIALILPGFHVLCAALELQSKSMVAGAVRMVYAIIFSLFLGFALTIGVAIYGFIDPDAVPADSCSATQIGPIDTYAIFPFVVIFSVCLMIVNQAKWKTMPIMGFIAFAGYLVNYFSAEKFAGSTQISSTLGAMTLSVLANLYSRLGPRTERLFLRLRNHIVPHIPYLNKHLDTSKKPLRYSPDSAPPSPSELEKAFDWPAPKPSLLRRAYAFVTNPKAAMGHDDLYPLQPTPDDSASSTAYSTPSTTFSGASTPEIHIHAGDGTTSPPSKPSSPPSAPSSPSTSRRGSSTVAPRKRPRASANYSLAAAAMLPGIFVLVPSGLAVSGSLVQGIQTANQLLNRTAANATAEAAQAAGQNAGQAINSVAFTVGYGVVQVAVGITVGLFVGSMVVYPFGKGGWGSRRMRSGLFSF
ncbi:hypothetical protein FH972_023339 [Carpinus fangiana]|uniref:Threonine/serine exporter-like N-terminal domain-containing protein n=1 Tax=Carpinus fangiana TaxID=176857 RepID=A0A5N6KX71_9ROSI|nr:hypothetical protein FH972_023339 [Carpinus fangiana]